MHLLWKKKTMYPLQTCIKGLSAGIHTCLAHAWTILGVDRPCVGRYSKHSLSAGGDPRAAPRILHHIRHATQSWYYTVVSLIKSDSLQVGSFTGLFVYNAHWMIIGWLSLWCRRIRALFCTTLYFLSFFLWAAVSQIMGVAVGYGTGGLATLGLRKRW